MYSAGGDGNDVVLTRIPTPPRPALIIQRLPPSSVRLLWPTNDPPFSLQFNTNLSSTNPSGWTFVAETPAIIGTNNVVTQNAAGVLKLYRLFKP